MHPEYLTPELVLNCWNRLRKSRGDALAYEALIKQLQSMHSGEVKELAGRCFQYATRELRAGRGSGSIDAALVVGRLVAKEDREFIARELESFVRALATTLATAGHRTKSRSLEGEEWYWPLRRSLTALYVLDPTRSGQVIHHLLSLASEARDDVLRSGLEDLGILIRSIGPGA